MSESDTETSLDEGWDDVDSAPPSPPATSVSPNSFAPPQALLAVDEGWESAEPPPVSAPVAARPVAEAPRDARSGGERRAKIEQVREKAPKPAAPARTAPNPGKVPVALSKRERRALERKTRSHAKQQRRERQRELKAERREQARLTAQAELDARQRREAEKRQREKAERREKRKRQEARAETANTDREREPASRPALEKSKKDRESRGSVRARDKKKPAQSGTWFILLGVVVLAGSAAFALLR
jgi:hypothetical protein